MRFQFAAARLGLIAFALGAAFAVAAIAGFRLQLLTYAQAMGMMIPAIALGGVALAASLTWLMSALRRNESMGRRVGLTALAGAILLLWTPVHMGIAAFSAPAIHDATSNTADPPQFVELLKQRKPGMNTPGWDGKRIIRFRGEDSTVNYVLHEYYQNDVTRPKAGFVVGAADPANTVFWRAFEATKKMDWTLVAFDEKERRIELTDSSFWFGAKSDIAIRVRPSGRGARADIRSANRYGDIDYGANIERIRAYFRALKL